MTQFTIGRSYWEYFNNQGNSNQGNKEETESTKNSAIPFGFTNYILQAFLMIQKRKEEKMNEKIFLLQKGRRKRTTSRHVAEELILISHCTKAAANPVNCVEDKGPKELNACIKHGGRGGRAHVSRRKPCKGKSIKEANQLKVATTLGQAM